MLTREYAVPRSLSASLTEPHDTTSFANDVATEYNKWENGSQAWLYRFFEKALTSYRMYQNDPSAYEELLEQEYIASLREKPGVMDTSRLVLYKLTTARTGQSRNVAARYARVVDCLFQMGVKNSDAAKCVKDQGGMDGILKFARGRAMPKETGREQLVQVDQEEDDRDEGEEQAEGTDLSEMIEEGPTKIFNPDTDVAIKLMGGTHAKLLSDDFPLQELFLLQCKKIAVDKQGQVRIVGKLWKPRST